MAPRGRARNSPSACNCSTSRGKSLDFVSLASASHSRTSFEPHQRYSVLLSPSPWHPLALGSGRTWLVRPCLTILKKPPASDFKQSESWGPYGSKRVLHPLLIQCPLTRAQWNALLTLVWSIVVASLVPFSFPIVLSTKATLRLGILPGLLRLLSRNSACGLRRPKQLEGQVATARITTQCSRTCLLGKSPHMVLNRTETDTQPAEMCLVLSQAAG